MTHELPHRRDRERAEALDRAISSRQGAGRSPDELAVLAAQLRDALELPALPPRGGAEVRAAAFAVRATRRRDRSRLYVAAAATLLVGAVGGGLLGALFDQPATSGPNLAQLSVAVKTYGGAARQALAHHQVNAAQVDVEKLYRVIVQAGGSATPPSGSSASSLTAERAEVSSLERTVTQLEAEVHTLQAAAPGTALSTTSSGTSEQSTMRAIVFGPSGPGQPSTTTTISTPAVPPVGTAPTGTASGATSPSVLALGGDQTNLRQPPLRTPTGPVGPVLPAGPTTTGANRHLHTTTTLNGVRTVPVSLPRGTTSTTVAQSARTSTGEGTTTTTSAPRTSTTTATVPTTTATVPTTTTTSTTTTVPAPTTTAPAPTTTVRGTSPQTNAPPTSGASGQ